MRQGSFEEVVFRGMSGSICSPVVRRWGRKGEGRGVKERLDGFDRRETQGLGNERDEERE
jgi:hypothetical protein